VRTSLAASASLHLDESEAVHEHIHESLKEQNETLRLRVRNYAPTPAAERHPRAHITHHDALSANTSSRTTPARPHYSLRRTVRGPASIKCLPAVTGSQPPGIQRMQRRTSAASASVATQMPSRREPGEGQG
jgi:hypothetical protein